MFVIPVCYFSFSFFPFLACQTVNPSLVWRLWKWGIKNPHKFAKSNWTPPWKIFSLLMVCRLDRENVINERDYTQPSLTGLWFNTAQFSRAIQLYSSFSLPSVSSLPSSLLSSLASLFLSLWSPWEPCYHCCEQPCLPLCMQNCFQCRHQAPETRWVSVRTHTKKRKKNLHT